MIPVPIKLLWVEDDEVWASVVAHVLRNAAERCHYALSITVVSTLAQARTVAPQFDAVLLDLGLPDIDCCNMVDALPALAPHWPPIIVLTGHDCEGKKNRCILNGADDYHRKGLESSDPHQVFESIVNAILRRIRDRKEQHAKAA
jgi:two-component system, OmpR family, response regulator